MKKKKKKKRKMEKSKNQKSPKTFGDLKMLKCFIDNPVQLDVGYYGKSFLDNNHSMYPYLSDRTTYPK